MIKEYVIKKWGIICTKVQSYVRTRNEQTYVMTYILVVVNKNS
jgi:hypothetical protein